MPRQRQQIWQEVVVRSPRPAMQNQKRLSAPQSHVINHDSVGVDKTILHGVNMIRLCNGTNSKQSQHTNEYWNFHDLAILACKAMASNRKD